MYFLRMGEYSVGAEINLQVGPACHAPLHLAAKFGHADATRLLLKRGTMYK